MAQICSVPDTLPVTQSENAKGPLMWYTKSLVTTELVALAVAWWAAVKVMYVLCQQLSL